MLRAPLSLPLVLILVSQIFCQDPKLDPERAKKLETIGLALRDYAIEHEQKLPAQLSALYTGWYLRDLAAYLPCESQEKLTDPKKIDQEAGFEILARALEKGKATLLVKEKGRSGAGTPLAFRSDGRIVAYEAEGTAGGRTEKPERPENKPSPPAVDVPKPAAVEEKRPPLPPTTGDPPGERETPPVTKKGKALGPGLEVANLDAEAHARGQRGVLVIAVTERQLRNAGVKKGDVLLRLGGMGDPDQSGEPADHEVSNRKAYEELLARASRAPALLLIFQRGGEENTVLWVRDTEPDDLVPDDAAPIDDASLKMLIDGLQHRDAIERVAAANEIATWGEGGLPALPALIKALGDPEPTVRMAAAGAIEGLGAEPGAASAIPALIKLLRDVSAPVRRQAAATLGTTASAAPPDGHSSAVKALRSAQRGDQDARVRQAAAESLSILGEN